MHRSFSERQLVALLRQGDEGAFRYLVRRYQKKLYAVAFGITLDREESFDIVQDVFLNVYRKIGRFRQQSSLSTWLHRITVNQCLNRKRRWKRRLRRQHRSIDSPELDPVPLAAPDGSDPETLYNGKLAVQGLWRALRQVPEQARAVFVLKEIQGMSYDEIARDLHIKKGTVSSRLFYVRRRLKAELQAFLEGETGHEE